MDNKIPTQLPITAGNFWERKWFARVKTRKTNSDKNWANIFLTRRISAEANFEAGFFSENLSAYRNISGSGGDEAGVLKFAVVILNGSRGIALGRARISWDEFFHESSGK